MRNAIRKNYAPIYTEPMSQGTRCHQLATYVIFESPLNMLCDNPSNYNREPECTEFIANIPTVWEKTVALDGKVGEFVAIARLHGNDWYVGALTNWDAREVELDLAFLGDGNYKLELFKDGINADRAACDYKKEVIPVPADRKVKVKMAPGGGWAARFINKMYFPCSCKTHGPRMSAGTTRICLYPYNDKSRSVPADCFSGSLL